MLAHQLALVYVKRGLIRAEGSRGNQLRPPPPVRSQLRTASPSSALPAACLTDPLQSLWRSIKIGLAGLVEA